MSSITLLTARNLIKHFPLKTGVLSRARKSVKAVDDVSFEMAEGENLAVVGESGCGKTTLGRMLCGLIEPTGGHVEFLGVPIDRMNRKELASQMQPIFQDPYSALNPRRTVESIVAKPFRLHKMPHSKGTLCELLDRVGLVPAKSFLTRYPHELSGGQRQRVVIARALATKPRLIIADEPISGLDATVQSQILDLMRSLQGVYRTTYLIITHDVTLVKSMCQRVAVMYLGKLVELGPTHELVQNPTHPYTLSLLRSFPSADPDAREWIDSPPIMGDVPSSIDPPSGCRFRPRCPFAVDQCALKEPALVACSRDHFVACPVYRARDKAGLQERVEH